jgi:hypothetical protein
MPDRRMRWAALQATQSEREEESDTRFVAPRGRELSVAVSDASGHFACIRKG